MYNEFQLKHLCLTKSGPLERIKSLKYVKRTLIHSKVLAFKPISIITTGTNAVVELNLI